MTINFVSPKNCLLAVPASKQSSKFLYVLFFPHCTYRYHLSLDHKIKLFINALLYFSSVCGVSARTDLSSGLSLPLFSFLFNA